MPQASHKFIGFSQDPLKLINFNDKTKWQQEAGDGRTYKLIKPDLEKDRQFTVAHLKTVKAYNADERLFIAGIANANIVDRVQERIDPRGLDIVNYLKNRQLLAHHSYYHPIGQVEELEVQDDGLYFRGWIGDPSKGPLTEMQNEIRSLVAQGILRTVSIGFIPKKIRAPLFDANGVLEEPTVIEQWELLEISVVAIPCNQDSLFSVRDYQSGKSGAKVDTDSTEAQASPQDDLENELAQTDLTVQTSKTNSTEPSSTDGSTASGDNNGVSSVSTKTTPPATPVKKDGATPAEPAPATPAADPGDNESVMLLRSLTDMCKKIYDACDMLVQKMDAKPASDSGGATPTPPAKDGETTDAKIAKMEASIDKLTKVVIALSERK